MIDIESEVYMRVNNALRVNYPDIVVTTEYTGSPPAFPFVSLVENDNAVLQRMRTDNVENAATVMYEVNVYTNTPNKKLDAKDIMSVVDGVLSRLGFTRTICSPISNLQDATIYRIVARYEAVVDKDLWLYQN